MFRDYVNNDKAVVALAWEEPANEFQMFAAIDVQLIYDEGVLLLNIECTKKIDVRSTIDRMVLMPKHVMRKCLSDGRLAEVVKPTGRQYRLKHGKVLRNATAAAIENEDWKGNECVIQSRNAWSWRTVQNKCRAGTGTTCT